MAKGIPRPVADDRVEPTDLSHRVGKLEFRLVEAYRRLAIYEKRILILEGKRDPHRADDAAEWDGGVLSITDQRETADETETETETGKVSSQSQKSHEKSHDETEFETGETSQSHDPEPWKAAGVSKATWYRRNPKRTTES